MLTTKGHAIKVDSSISNISIAHPNYIKYS